MLSKSARSFVNAHPKESLIIFVINSFSFVLSELHPEKIKSITIRQDEIMI
jgi:hypothetical protein